MEPSPEPKFDPATGQMTNWEEVKNHAESKHKRKRSEVNQVNFQRRQVAKRVNESIAASKEAPSSTAKPPTPWVEAQPLGTQQPFASADPELSALLMLERQEEDENTRALAIKEKATEHLNNAVLASQTETNNKLVASKQQLFDAVDNTTKKSSARKASLRDFIKKQRRQAVGVVVNTPASTPGSASSLSTSSVPSAKNITPNRLDFGTPNSAASGPSSKRPAVDKLPTLAEDSPATAGVDIDNYNRVTKW